MTRYSRAKLPIVKSLVLKKRGQSGITHIDIVDGYRLRNTWYPDFCGVEARRENSIFIPRKRLWVDIPLKDEAKIFLKRYDRNKQFSPVSEHSPEAMERAHLKDIVASAAVRRYLSREVDPFVRGKVLGRKKLRIRLVDGRLVRAYFHTGFIQGGHDKHPDYRKFIPPREIWVEQAFKKELEPILVHELVERQIISLMQRTWARPADEATLCRWYDFAHERALSEEMNFRRYIGIARFPKG